MLNEACDINTVAHWHENDNNNIMDHKSQYCDVLFIRTYPIALKHN